MQQRRVHVTGILVLAVVGVLLTSAPAAGQAGAASNAAPGKSVPRTPWGAPDLQGVWSGATVTPLERPVGAKEFLSDADVQRIEREAVQRATDEARGDNATQDVAGAYNDFWWDRGTRVVANRRTSLIVDPSDGRIPPLTAEMAKHVASPAARRVQETRRGTHPAASYTDTDLWDRCLTRGLPITPGPYNNNYQIFQTPPHVAILHEMVHDVRIVPLDNRPHLAPAVRQWNGDARGRWDGDTLVVESTNFSPKQEYTFGPRTSSGGMRLIERFTRLDKDTLMYEFTVEDPKTFSRPFSAEFPMRKGEAVYEYACHEGNYGMVGILGGSREIERKAAEDARKGSRQ
jgi:hypothetical protein